MKRIQFIIIYIALSAISYAYSIDVFNFANKEQKQRYLEITSELRCPSCQSQAINDSNSPIASDLKTKVFTMLNEQYSNKDILGFMEKHYGAYILYRPELNKVTIALWAFPLVIILIGLSILIFNIKTSKKLKKIQGENKTEMEPLHDH